MYKNGVTKLLAFSIAMVLSAPANLAKGEPNSGVQPQISNVLGVPNITLLVANPETASLGLPVVPQVEADPGIVFIPPVLLLTPTWPWFDDEGWMVSLTFDLSPPFIVVFAYFSVATAVSWCWPTYLNSFGFTYEITFPTGQMEIGWGIGAEAGFEAFSPGPFPLFVYAGDFCTYAVDYEGNQSFTCGPVVVWSS